jgi:division protein CdvB (Snf7/Vps24/ESCRT-III family)
MTTPNLIDEAVQEATPESELESDASQAALDTTQILQQDANELVDKTAQDINNKIPGGK